MKTNKQLDQKQLDALREFYEKPEYIDFYPRDLVERINCNMTVFSLAIERLATDSFEPISHNEGEELSLFWAELERNIRVILEINQFTERVLKGHDYDCSCNGSYLFYRSLDDVVREWREQS